MESQESQKAEPLVLALQNSGFVAPAECGEATRKIDWLNAIESFFAKLTKRRLKRGFFHSVADLKAAIDRFVAEINADPKPFVWTADPKRVLAAVKRGKQALESIH